MEKKCLICGKIIIKPVNESVKAFITRRKFCSKKCSYVPKEDTSHLKKYQFKIGEHPNVSTEFKKGNTTWNTGIKVTFSEQHKENLKKSLSNFRLTETLEHKKARGNKISQTRKERHCPNGHLGLIGEINTKWKGEDANYNSKHRWIQNHWDKTGTCEQCGTTPIPKKKTRLKFLTHWHNISGKYVRERCDWMELCPKCHIHIHKK